MNTAESLISEILNVLNRHEVEKPNHKKSCEFLRQKFVELEVAIKSNNKISTELIEWTKWFAPRIIYDGINNPSLLGLVEKLSKLLK